MIYNKKITFQILSDHEDNIGNQIPQWSDFFTAWANVNAVTGREYYSACQVNSENDVIFKIRYSKKIADFNSTEVRILYNDKIFDVKHIEDYQEQHKQLTFRTVVKNG